MPEDKLWEQNVYHNFVIRTDLRDEMSSYLNSRGVDTRVHYPIPIHLQDAAKGLGYSLGSFPKAEEYAKTMLSLPIYPELLTDEVEYIVSVITNFFD